MRRTALLLCVVNLTVSVLLSSPAPQSGVCDSSLKPDPDSPHKYASQPNDSNRCEGLYTNKVGAAGEILLVSFTAGNVSLDPKQASVTVYWQNPARTTARFRAFSLRQRLYYRMDSSQPQDKKAYTWPLAVPAAVGLKANEIGLVAWVAMDVAGNSHSVYFPLSSSEQLNRNELKVSFVAPYSLTKTTLVVSRLNNQKQFDEIEKIPQTGSQPALRPIDFVLQRATSSGFYLLSLGGTDSNGDPLAGSFWVYIP